jgi:tetratricopeptide (TPR) repeat protein
MLGVWINMDNAVQAQSNDNSIRNAPLYRLQVGVYNRAIKYNDVDQAINALYNLCVMDPQNDSILHSLAYLYFDQQKYVSAIMTINDIMMLNPRNLSAQEMKAVSLDRIGAKDKALEEYESLYLKNNDIGYMYKMIISQFELQRYNECANNINILLQNDEIDERKLVYQAEDNSEQEITMRASLLNIRGMIEFERGNKEEARKYYSEALTIAPEFYLCLENLKELDK